MQPQVLLDYDFAVAREGYVVRALLRFRGQAPTNGGRIPLNISLVLDRSGSMGGEPLAAARSAAAMLVRRLAPEDVVSVVAYDDDVITVAEPATGEAQHALPDAIGRIEAGGTTNLSGGWLRGRELVARRRREGATNRVLLLTDGLANAGITAPAMLLGLCRAAREEGITTTTIGFGPRFDERLLAGMADAGGGSTYYIERADQASGVFEEELEGLLTLCAQNLAVEVRPGDAVQLVAVHHDWPSAAVDGGRRFELGDLYAREPKSLLVELFVPGVEELGERTLATVTVHAHALTAAGGVERQEVTFPVSGSLSRDGREEPEVRREMLLLETARAREEALRRQRDGDWGGAGRVLEQAARMIVAAPPQVAEALAEQAADLEAMAQQVAAGELDAADAKYLAQRAYNARRGKQAYEEKLRRTR
jgi:Ca-activated chloride channel family protein